MSMTPDDKTVPPHELNAVLHRFAPFVVPRQVDSPNGNPGFSGAVIWRVATSLGDFALRRWPNPGMPPVRLQGLHRLLEHLRRQGLDFVSVPLRTNDGMTLVNQSGSLWQLEPWMPGHADYLENPSIDRLKAAMKALAQWHLAAARFQPEPAHVHWFYSRPAEVCPAIAERLITLRESASLIHRIQDNLQRFPASPLCETATTLVDLFQRHRSSAVDDLERVRDIRIPLQPCLRDVWHDHILLTGDRVTGLIDPSACRTETVACDLARLLASLVGESKPDRSIALDEYQRWRPLSSAELSLIPVLDRTGVLLSAWTWLTWMCVDHRLPANPVRSLARMQSLMRRLQNW